MRLMSVRGHGSGLQITTDTPGFWLDAALVVLFVLVWAALLVAVDLMIWRRR